VPYIYSFARDAAEHGYPILRHPFLQYPTDPNTYDIAYDFFLGDALLVCPVVEQGARERQCYLPPGEWVNWWTGHVYDGPGRASLPAPLEQIPLLARAGAIIPTYDPDVQTLVQLGRAGAPDLDDLVVRVVPHPGVADIHSEFTLYDGSRLVYHAWPGAATMSVSASPVERRLEVVLPANGEPLRVDGPGGPLPRRPSLAAARLAGGYAYAYDSGASTIHVILPAAGDVEISVAW
jgi:hypothetical protein